MNVGPLSPGLLVSILVLIASLGAFGFWFSLDASVVSHPLFVLAILLVIFWLGIVWHLLEKNRQLREAMKKMAALEEINQLKDQLLTITSHELRTPITPIKANLQMLLSDYFGPLNETQKKSIQMVLRNAEHLDRLIEDILDVSRLEAGTMKFEYQTIDLLETIQSSVQSIQPLAQQKNIQIFHEPGMLPPLLADPHRLSQVMNNLLTNAVKFSHPGGVIRVSSRLENHEILVAVQDTGIGVSAEEIPKLFKPFSQADTSLTRRYEGFGLGLAISKGIVENHGGSIWMQSNRGSGAVVSFKLPILQVPPPLKRFSFFDTPKTGGHA